MKKLISKTSKSVDPRKKLSPEVRVALDVYSKETDKKIKILTLDFQRYTGALSEDFQGKVSAVSEQFSGLNEKIDTINKTLDMHTEMIGALAEDVSILKEDVAVLKEDVSEIKEELKNKGDKSEIVRLDRRIAVLEHST